MCFNRALCIVNNHTVYGHQHHFLGFNRALCIVNLWDSRTCLPPEAEVLIEHYVL